jgi:hypothetical protein
MRDEQVRRYARHILLPDVGGLGQTALMVSAARIELHESEPDAELTCALYLAAGGVGTVVVSGATADQLAEIAAHGADTAVAPDGAGRDIALAPRPAWWPASARDGDATALAFWRGGLAAVRWMADAIDR